MPLELDDSNSLFDGPSNLMYFIEMFMSDFQQSTYSYDNIQGKLLVTCDSAMQSKPLALKLQVIEPPMLFTWTGSHVEFVEETLLRLKIYQLCNTTWRFRRTSKFKINKLSIPTILS